MAYLYVTTQKFTKEDASSLRIFTFCKLLKELNKEVIVISLDEVIPNKINIYKEIKFISIRSVSANKIAKSFNYLLHKKRLNKCVLELTEKYSIEGIFFYDIPFPSINYLKNYAIKNKIKLFHDSVEWYSSEQFKWGKLALPYLLKNLLNKYLIDKHINVISISNYLNNYFLSKGIHSTRIPIMLDMKEVSFNKINNTNKLCLFYAGSPGKKDYLDVIIEGLSRLEEQELEKIDFQIYGITKNQLVNNCGIPKNVIKKCEHSLSVNGRVSREEILLKYQNVDFTVLLRSPNLRYAKAGFPTKVVESLASATPVICNITSDLGNYLEDGINSILVKDCTAEEFVKSIRKALLVQPSQKQDFYKRARHSAEMNFDYRLYKDQFNRFSHEK